MAPVVLTVKCSILLMSRIVVLIVDRDVAVVSILSLVTMYLCSMRNIRMEH